MSKREPRKRSLFTSREITSSTAPITSATVESLRGSMVVSQLRAGDSAPAVAGLIHDSRYTSHGDQGKPTLRRVADPLGSSEVVKVGNAAAASESQAMPFTTLPIRWRIMTMFWQWLFNYSVQL